MTIAAAADASFSRRIDFAAAPSGGGLSRGFSQGGERMVGCRGFERPAATAGAVVGRIIREVSIH